MFIINLSISKEALLRSFLRSEPLLNMDPEASQMTFKPGSEFCGQFDMLFESKENQQAMMGNINVFLFLT